MRLKLPFKSSDEVSAKLDAIARENTALVERIAAVQKRFQSMARSIWRVEEDERRRIARELHDNLGQQLTAAQLRLEKLPASDDRDAAAELVASALNDTRNLSRLLRPSVLDDLGLEAALQWLARNTRDNAGLPVKLSGSIDRRLDDETETMLFRIAQEALTNAVKHAKAARAEIAISRSGNLIEMRIRDNGDGFDVDEKFAETENTTVGLAGMRDRVAFFGGDFVINSSPGRGTTLTVSLETTPFKKA